ncbi:hypothetical protein D9611_000228 [Ephemerocybe angulata]|uniref:Uncharacterized protein n=1 Tax=Ephemerocybe angulata TaxID=980116 RepID=A0A8H5F6W2_9AGAR|nr:hypothetical protein D9611_000228 [Tulosesus angulatus]
MPAPEPVVYRHEPHAVLPPELVDSLNQVYFLHRLATEPEKLVPPGKTMLSMMIHSQMKKEKSNQDQSEVLLERVQEVAHRAFWNEAIESLSSALPSVQLPRLKRLYSDLAEALTPLFPPNHKAILSLEAHLPPTSSPLHSALIFLKELLLVLRGRCAPIRDKEIDQLYTKLDEWRDPVGQPPMESSTSQLAVLVVDTIRELVSLAESMKADLNAAVIGSMGEQEVKGYVLHEAKSKERDLIIDLWDARQEPTGQALREQWRSWVALLPAQMEAPFSPVESDRRWILRLMAQLAANTPITCELPSSLYEGSLRSDAPSNTLPPHFFFVAPKLLYAQNYLQAVTIAASLRSLTRLPAPSSSPGSTLEHNFMERIWALLKSEIDEDANANGVSNEFGSTKLINLSDEVIRARRLTITSGDVHAGEESRLREAVDRTLRFQDPVFQLLHRRLSESLTKQVLEYMSGEQLSRQKAGMPVSMKTGRTIGENRPGKRVALPDHPGSSSRSEGATAAVVVKGFEEPVLVDAVGGVFRELLQSVTWVERVWGDMV